MAMVEKYATDHHLTLDRSLSFRDLGMSAFRGRNAKEGALRAFLDAIAHDMVPEHSFLLIESLDRLSRDRILAAQALFFQIIQAGVTIVTLVDQRAYSAANLNHNPLDLMISLVSMMRANEESELKSQRVRAAFEIKRNNLSDKPWSARCPGWLRLDKSSQQFVVVEERADVVRRIFREALAGVGHQTIARRLNEEQVSLFGHGNQRGKIWQTTLIRHLLRSPTVIGIFVPFSSEWVDEVSRLRPHTPIVDYYPPIIERADWDTVQAKRAAWSAHHHNNVAKTGRANLLAGLSRCPFCDRAIVMVGWAKPNWRYLLCRRAFNGVGCSDHWVRYPGIEDTLTIDIEDVLRSCPKPVLTSEVRSHRLKQIRIRLHTLRIRQNSIRAERVQLRQSSRPTLAAAENVDDEIDRLLTDRKRLRVDRPRWLDVTLSVKLDRLWSVARATVVDRHELHSVLRSLVTKVVVDWERNQLVFHWKHGGESTVRVAMKPQRQVANPRRADRPRYNPGESAPLLPEVKR